MRMPLGTGLLGSAICTGAAACVQNTQADQIAPGLAGVLGRQQLDCVLIQVPPPHIHQHRLSRLSSCTCVGVAWE